MDAVLLVVILGLVLLFSMAMMLLIIRSRDRATPRAPSVSGPCYSHDPAHADYYRPRLDTNRTSNTATSAKPGMKDPRDVPLPKCPQCGAAVGFGETKCFKCGRMLGQN